MNARNFRKKDKSCKRILGLNKLCLADQDRTHFFIYCEYIKSCFNKLKYILREYSGKSFEDYEIIHLGISVSNKKLTRLLSWFVVKYLFKMFNAGMKDYLIILRGILEDVKFILEWEIHSGSVEEIKSLRNIIMDVCKI